MSQFDTMILILLMVTVIASVNSNGDRNWYPLNLLWAYKRSGYQMETEMDEEE